MFPGLASPYRLRVKSMLLPWNALIASLSPTARGVSKRDSLAPPTRKNARFFRTDGLQFYRGRLRGVSAPAVRRGDSVGGFPGAIWPA